MFVHLFIEQPVERVCILHQTFILHNNFGCAKKRVQNSIVHTMFYKMNKTTSTFLKLFPTTVWRLFFSFFGTPSSCLQKRNR